VILATPDSGKQSRSGRDAAREQSGRLEAAASKDSNNKDAGSDEVRALLQRADQAKADGRLADAVADMLRAAAIYTQRSLPRKAVAVLRETVRLSPGDPEVRVRYGETLSQLRMLEDAAREFATACSLYESQGQIGAWLDVLQRLVELDSDNLHGRLQLAEALSRAGKTAEAAAAFRQLAEIVQQRGELADWELVAERLLQHDLDDTALAHELALHYVRAGRHAYALPKLILCYEAVPGGAELLGLIIDTLESLGQREKAAVICRQLLATYRKTGLAEEGERTLERLYYLDPEDPEARTYMGVLEPAVEGGTVIEFEPDWSPPPPGPSSRRSDSSGFPAGRTAPARRKPESVGLAPLPPLRPQPTAKGPPAVDQNAPLAGPGRSEIFNASGPGQSLGFAPVSQASRSLGFGPGNSLGFGPAPTDDDLDFQDGPRQQARAAAPARGGEAVVRPAALPAGVAPPRPQAAANRLDEAAMTMEAQIPDLQTLRNAAAPDDDDEEFGAATADHTVIADPSMLGFDLPELSGLPPPPAAMPPRPASPSMHTAPSRAPSQPGPARAPTALAASSAAAAAPSALQPAVTAASKRPDSLPRPRLARRAGTMTELPTTARDMSKDLSTLDFFVERGYRDSAVALLDELEKRYPDSHQLRIYRARIERLQRS